MSEERSSQEKSILRELSWVDFVFSAYYRRDVSDHYLCGTENEGKRTINGRRHDRDILLWHKISYRFREPERFEIIVFPYQHKENTYYIKRIIGMPGETVQIKDGYVYINGVLLEEHYGNELMETPGIAETPITLGNDEYFVLGDNRNHSSDSRDPNVGILHREDLLGRAWIRIWPVNDFGVIRHE